MGGITIRRSFIGCPLGSNSINGRFVQESVFPLRDIRESNLHIASTDTTQVLFVRTVGNGVRCVGNNLRPGAGITGGNFHLIRIRFTFKVQLQFVHMQCIFGVLHPVFTRTSGLCNPFGGRISIVCQGAVSAGGEGGMSSFIRGIGACIKQLIRRILFFFNQEVVRFRSPIFWFRRGSRNDDLCRFHSGGGRLDDRGAGVIGAELRRSLAVAHQVAAGQRHNLSSGEHAGTF